MRSQTLATMDEASFQRMAAAVATQNIACSPSKSSERLIDGRKTPDFEFYSQIFPPELARQIMMDRMKRNSMRTQATQTDRSRHSTSITSPTSSIGLPPQSQFSQKVYMVSEGVQTNGLKRTTTVEQQTSPPSINSSGGKSSTKQPVIRPSAAVTQPQPQPPLPPLPPYQDPPPPPSQSPLKKKPEVKPKPGLPPYLSGQLPGYEIQVYHLDGATTKTSEDTPEASWYGTAPRSSKHSGRGHHHHKHSHNHNHHKATRSHSSGNVLDEKEVSSGSTRGCSPKVVSSVNGERCSKHLQKSYSAGKLIEDDQEMPQKRSQKAVKFQPILPERNGANSDEEVSDRELPELAPIEKPRVEYFEKDEEPDLGRTLSPLGSTSSLQDLMESSSARASEENPCEKTKAVSTQSSTWIERERQKKAVVVVEPSEDKVEEVEIAPPQKTTSSLSTTQRMDSVTSAKTNETSTTATSEDYVTATEVPQRSEEEEDEEEVERVEHYLESPAKEEEEAKEDEKEESQQYQAVCEMQLKSNKEENPTKEESTKSPTHSFASSSSGSYSVHNTENNNGKKPQDQPPSKKEVEGGEENAQQEEVTRRKQELKLDLDVNAPPVMLHNLPTSATTASDESSTENSMIWQRIPLGSGDVKRKRQAFEHQIKAMSMDEADRKAADLSPILPNTEPPATAISANMAQKILSQETTGLTGSPGLARSPAMHQGFRQEEWVVERTPVNTPDTANDKVVVAMINLSDEETSNHVDSDVVFKSSTAATTPQDGSLMSSLGPSSMQDVETGEEVQAPATPPKESASAPENLAGQAVLPPVAPPKAVVEPPADFADSPDHKGLKGFHEAVIDQPLPQEEQLLMASEEMVAAPPLQITEAFQPEVVYSPAKKASVVQKEEESAANAVATSSMMQTLEQQRRPPRKLSSTSSTSRPSTSASKTQHRSRSSSKERLLSTLAGSENVPQTSNEEDEVEGLYMGGYDKAVWAFIGKLSPPSASLGQEQEESKMVPLQRSESMESTISEREFRKKYQAITHRMVHRKSSAVMYSRILERTFECNKSVRVMRVRGEFGFRIHGSRPVVVSAIEPNTPAESSGLEVGDIILTINGINVLDLPHTEVVKTAQTGCDELELGLARVQDLSTEQLREMDPMNIAFVKLDDSLRIIMSGYLWKLSRSMIPTTTVGCASALVSKWSRRFFVLRADSCLYFFKKENESRPLGATLVAGCDILLPNELNQDEAEAAKPHSFKLKLASTASMTPTILCLAADNQDEYDNWMHSITHVSQTPNKDEDDLWREMSRQKMKMSPVDFINADCQGYLLKLDSLSKSWKTRFCLLSDAFLYLYLDKESECAQATLCLHGYRVQSTGNIGGNKKHTFELIPPDSSLKNFYFVADTETEKKRWMASLEYSIDRWMKLT